MIRTSRSVVAATLLIGAALAGCTTAAPREEAFVAGAPIEASASVPGAGNATVLGGIGDAQQSQAHETYLREQRAREHEYELARKRAESERRQRERGQGTYADSLYEPPYSQPPGFYSEHSYQDRYGDDGDYYGY
ncbi:MAG TPA: hypothetical protein VEL28_02660 [Candidatus Binatia bacterium]|nr:hypothetical protein [Candidatus Binatia bacterium]